MGRAIERSAANGSGWEDDSMTLGAAGATKVRSSLARWRWILPAVAALALTVSACAPSGADSDCGSAFRRAEPRAGAPYDASPLDDAIRACADLAEWRATWNALPASHPNGEDPVGFLIERCKDPTLAVTSLCQEVVP